MGASRIPGPTGLSRVFSQVLRAFGMHARPGPIGFMASAAYVPPLPSARIAVLAIPVAGVTKLVDADFEDAAKKLGPGVSAAIIHAFATVESGGKSGFGPEGLPIIAYEGHIFRTSTNRKYDKTHRLLSYRYVKKAGPEWQVNNKDQKTAWRTLCEAAALDYDAALKACSWGMFQVMGFNFKSCGYTSVSDFVQAMKAGERGQLDAFVGYCKDTDGIVEALKKPDYKQLATLYNGKDYGDYDQRIEKFYKKYGGK